MIETKKPRRDFGDKAAVQDLDLGVEPGEILGFLGPNGAGKSTTVKILTCMIRPSRGSARVAGYDVEQDPMEVKRRLGYVPEAGGAVRGAHRARVPDDGGQSAWYRGQIRQPQDY